MKEEIENSVNKKKMRAEFGTEKDKQSCENDYAVEKQIQELIITTYYIIQLEFQAMVKIINSINCVWTSEEVCQNSI